MWPRLAASLPNSRHSVRTSAMPTTAIAEMQYRRDATPGSYDPNNIFAKILRGEMSAHKVYEDEALARLPLHHAPGARPHAGYSQKPGPNLLDVGPDHLAHLIKVVQKIAQAASDVFEADGITVQQFNEEAGGQVVFHLHVHVIRAPEGGPKPPASLMESPEVLATQAQSSQPH